MTELEQFNAALERLFAHADRIPDDARQLFAEYLLTGSPPVTTPNGKRNYLNVRTGIRRITRCGESEMDPLPRATIYLLYLLETMEFPDVANGPAFRPQNTQAQPEWHRKAAAALDEIEPIT